MVENEKLLKYFEAVNIETFFINGIYVLTLEMLNKK